MLTKDFRPFMGKLNRHLTSAFENAHGLAASRTHYELTVDHLIWKLLDEGTGDIPPLLRHFNITPGDVLDQTARALDRLPNGNSGRVTLSPGFHALMEASWVISSITLNQSSIRSGSFIEAILQTPELRGVILYDFMYSKDVKPLAAKFAEVVATSVENDVHLKSSTGADGKPATSGDTPFDKYTVDVTAKALAGEIDPVFGRDAEIRQVIDILSRRRKNNPILVGEAGVGKTAIVEGFALKIVAGEVVESLRDCTIRSLDLALLQAGASIKGEFENRLKGVITQVKEMGDKIIMFIDEAHTLIGAGGAAGSGDAANLLKPELARGRFRTIAATTWSEYKKYIEKDPALERRFQMVKVDEPDEANAAVMLRGVRNIYEKHHGLTITDSAIQAAVSLSKRYIAGRQLPDKAVDLLDTAAARVRMSAAGKPGSLDFAERKLMALETKLASLDRDLSHGYLADPREREEIVGEIQTTRETIEKISAKWSSEREVADQIQAKKKELADNPQGEANSGHVAELTALRARLSELQGEEPLAMPDVDATIVASIVSDWTGVPAGRMMKDTATALLEYESFVGSRIIGQSEALAEVGSAIRIAKSGMGRPDMPIGVFLFVGPSGVGKTETARATADLLFGGEKFTTVINMSEYLEKHSVSQLKGSPPGYVGYGEGGVLTEAVRRRPYSVVLLDEVEKAHPEVMNLFYQVFDKGIMRDGEGREIDFKNTVIIMTSNIGSQTIIDSCQNGNRPGSSDLTDMIRPELYQYFQTALLARMNIIPFYPLGSDSIRRIVQLKLSGVAKRLKSAHRIELIFPDAVLDGIAEQCTLVETGARNVDVMIERSIMPDLSRTLVEQMIGGTMPSTVELSWTPLKTVEYVLR